MNLRARRVAVERHRKAPAMDKPGRSVGVIVDILGAFLEPAFENPAHANHQHKGRDYESDQNSKFHQSSPCVILDVRIDGADTIILQTHGGMPECRARGLAVTGGGWRG
jgi:hypothetical protein